MTDASPAGRAPASGLGALRALWPFIRRHRGLFASWLFALAISSAATLALPVAFRRVIDHGFASGTPDAIDSAFLPLLGVALVVA
jgi:ATP-binding cassette subfamily B protein